jgi:ABC-2 type transport system ATP-binding protein
MTIIQTDNLTKTFGRNTTALAQLTLSVQQGEVFGYLGPNGAGKTTTIKLLLDLIRPTNGTARVLNMDARKDSQAIRRRVGFLPGELALWDNLTAQETITYVGRTRGGVDAAYVRQLAERLNFDVSKRVRTYSLGNKRKLGLILALMNKAELLILDEPTNGLDPLMQQTFYALLGEARAEGRTVFMSSHNLAEVQATCDRVAILRNGKLQMVQSVADLRQAEFSWVTLTLQAPLAAAHLQGVRSLPNVSEVQADGAHIHLKLRGAFDPLLRALGDAYIVQIKTAQPALEEIFLSYYDTTAPASNGAGK